jgi:hypothetical protein
LPTLILPFDSDAKVSIIGATAPQVGHQGAQANNRTGNGDFKTVLSKLASVTIIGCGRNNSWVGIVVPHFPHLGPASILLAGMRFLAPQSVQRILNASEGSVLPACFSRDSPHFPHFAFPADRFAGILFLAPHALHFKRRKSVCSI